MLPYGDPELVKDVDDGLGRRRVFRPGDVRVEESDAARCPVILLKDGGRRLGDD